MSNSQLPGPLGEFRTRAIALTRSLEGKVEILVVFDIHFRVHSLLWGADPSSLLLEEAHGRSSLIALQRMDPYGYVTHICRKAPAAATLTLAVAKAIIPVKSRLFCPLSPETYHDTQPAS
jgi:hypothetical protein